MKTEVLKIKNDLNNSEIINKAVKYIKNDELVAIPTETVYGLGANGLSDNACKKIFITKGRPQDNPLILHISNIEELDRLVNNIPKEVEEMLNNLWPGPLTVIFNKSDIIPDSVTAGGSTVAIRMPNHNIAREIIKKSGVPIAAPSANLSGRPSPTNAEDVYEDLNGKINLIVDGGQSNIGIESTVLDITEKPYTILRPGFFDKYDLEIYLDKVVYDNSLISDNSVPKSPGQKYRHYAPKASMEVIIGNNSSIKKYIEKYKKNSNKKTAYILFEESIDIVENEEIVFNLGSKDNLNEMAFNLFTMIRHADKENVEHIICEGTDKNGIGIGIMNRLKKSSSNTLRKL